MTNSAAKIVVTITDEGLKVDAIDFVGGKCATATEFLRKLGTVESVDKKPEFYQQKVAMQDNKLS